MMPSRRPKKQHVCVRMEPAPREREKGHALDDDGSFGPSPSRELCAI